MTDWNAVTAFMANVVAWPVSIQDPGYVNLHYSMVDKKNPSGKKIVTGWPIRTVDDLVQKCAWSMSTNYIKDLWFCTSRQSMAGKNSKGNPKAIRGTQFATHQKSIWIDVDVEPNNPKKYGTLEEALAAILLFAKTVKLPTPSAFVFSGSGIHVYWISKDPLTPAEWGPYASGLKSLLLANAVKCDAGLTTDIARILRVPGTLNHKTVPPKPVQLSPTPLRLYDFADKLGFLRDFAAPITVPSALTQPSVFAEGMDASKFGKPNPAFAHLADAAGLQGGIEKAEHLLKAEPIFKQCGFMKHALKTEGADYDNPLWNLSVLCATFMENGNAIAHAISKGHASYSEADTQALYDRKVAERHDRGLGYPSCATIQGNGCSSCATCPLLAKGKSPLNIRPAVTATVTPQVMGQTPAAQALSLPDGFDLNPDGIICKVVEKTSREGELSLTLVPLFQAVLSNFWVQKFPDCLNYTVTVDKGFTHDASVPAEEISRQGFKAYLAGPTVRTLINVAGIQYLEGFYLSMLGKLRAAAAAQQAVPFGWYEVDGKRKGFVYGGNVFEDDGTVRPCGIGDANIRRRFTPTGTLQPWYDAAATVTNRKRPELTAIVLISFLSPLLALVGKDSVMFSLWGDTAAGKSSAYKVGMAVWGHPKLSKGSKQTTRNNVTTQMKETQNLPFYWDEIRTVKGFEMVADVMHEVSDGVEKGRNVSGQKSGDRGMWKLALAVASNKSYAEFLRGHDPNHAASLVRVLEWKVRKIAGSGVPGHMKDADASALLAVLESNYGAMGLKYAQFLARNHVQIEAECKAKCNEIQDSLQGDNEDTSDRYWTTSVALMTMAAVYAQQLGVDVDPYEIEQFMRRVYAENAKALNDRGFANGVVDNTETILNRYLKDRQQDMMIWTDRINIQRGRAPMVNTLKAPTVPRKGIETRWAIENQLLIIATNDFDKWVREQGHSLKQIEDGLEQTYGAKWTDKLRIGTGTLFLGGREPCIMIPVPMDGDLADMMLLYAPQDLRDKLQRTGWRRGTVEAAQASMDTAQDLDDDGEELAASA